MDKVTIVPLGDPVAGLAELRLREPTYALYRRLGPPERVRQDGEGRTFIETDRDVVASYARACLVNPLTETQLDDLSLRDGLALEKAVTDFFEPAASPSTERPTSLSSAPDGGS